MKHLLKSFNPKQIFGHKKSRSVSKSDPPFSFGSYSSDSSSSSEPHRPTRTRSDRFDFVQAFKMIDLDGDGKITRYELHSLFKRVGRDAPPPTDDELAAMINDIDRDGDGCISLEELEAVGSVFDPTAAGVDELKGAFDFFDVDHDGKISAEELHEGFVALGDERCTLEDCRRMIESVDKNRDGFVCFDDFRRMMDRQR